MTIRSASAPLLPLARAVEGLCSGVDPVNPRHVRTAEAMGATAAADIRAVVDRPARPVAARDGWAVAFAEVAGASLFAPVLLAQAPPWRDAGEALPDGADTVLPPDAVSGREATADAPPGDGALGPGADLRAGDLLVRAGERLGALQVMAVAEAGIDEIEVRRPRIRLIVTGAEPGYEAPLASAIAALLGAAGGDVVAIVPVPDDVEAIAAAMAEPGADAVFVLGGTGFGRTDLSAASLARAGTLSAHGIALRPGETAGYGIAAGRPVLLLPGRREAALAALLCLGRPLLQRLAGAAGEAPLLRATLLRKISSALGLAEAVFLRRTPDGLDPLGGLGIPLRRLLLADGIVLVPPEQEGYPEGTEVAMMPL